METKSADENYEALNKYAINLIEQAKNGKLDPVIGRDDEIRRVIRVLARRTKVREKLLDCEGGRLLVLLPVINNGLFLYRTILC